MQERALAPWGNVEEVRSTKRHSDAKKKDGIEKAADLKPKDRSRTAREDPHKTAEPKTKSSTSKTSAPAASKIYSNGKTRTLVSDTSKQTIKSSKTPKASSVSGHSAKVKTGLSAGLSDAERARVDKEKQRLKNERRKSKDDDSKQRPHKEVKSDNVKKESVRPLSTRKTTSSSSTRSHETSERVKVKVRDGRNEKETASEKRPGTSGRSRRAGETAQPTSTSKKHLKEDARGDSEGKHRSKTSESKTSDTSRSARHAERRQSNTEVSGARAVVVPHDGNEVLLPSKNVNKVDSLEKIPNGYDAVASGGRTSRAGSARSRAASGSEGEHYSDDFSSYGSDFESDQEQEEDDGTGTHSSSNNSNDEDEITLNRDRSPKRIQAPAAAEEEKFKRLRPAQSSVEHIPPNGRRNRGVTARASEILSFVHLDRSKHLAIHFEGLKYDSYMAAFGARDRRQDATQTVDRAEEECQTEPALCRDMWTQHPAKGATGPVMGAGVGVAHVVDVLGLSRFVQSAAAVIIDLLEEELNDIPESNTQGSSTRAGIRGLSVIQTNLPLYDSLPVTAVAPAPSKASRLVCAFEVHNVAGKDESKSRSLLCLWNSREPAHPKELLTCQGSPQRVTWLGDEIVVAALEDSSLAAWDLRRTTTSIIPTAGFGDWGGATIPKRAAAFNSALADKELCQIVGLCSLTARSGHISGDEEEATVVTLDFEGHLVFWSLIQIQETDNALDDLAVAPQSTIKLVRSAGVKISFNNAQFTSLAVIDQELFAGRDDGGVLHMSRHAALKFPKNYMARPPGNDTTEAPSGIVTCLCGVGQHLVVASGTTNDSSVLLIFDRASAYPLHTVTHWAPVTDIVSLSSNSDGNETSVALFVNSDRQLCRLDLVSATVEPLYENVQSLGIHRTANAAILVIGRVDGAVEEHVLP